jgi:hypothetical protein
MKIDDNQPSIDDANLNADDVESEDIDSQSAQSDDQPSAFSQVLAKKKSDERDATSSRTEKKKEAQRQPNPTFSQQPLIREVSGSVTSIDSKHTVGLPPDLQQLVREITVAMDKAGNEKVQIEMNSDVLKGLQIKIERQQGELQVQFLTDSQQVSGLINRNIDALSQSLSSLGEGGVNIRVTGTREAGKSWESKYRGQQGGQAQGGFRGGRG